MSAIGQAVLTTDLDERQLIPLLGAGQWAGLAALGVVVGRVAQVVAHDRKLLRSWLSELKEDVV